MEHKKEHHHYVKKHVIDPDKMSGVLISILFKRIIATLVVIAIIMIVDVLIK